MTTDHVLVETWTLLRWRAHRRAAEAFWHGIPGIAAPKPVGQADQPAAWTLGQAFPDQDFSLVDRPSFAVMERLALERVATFDDDFAVYRWGPGRRRALEVLRSPSTTSQIPGRLVVLLASVPVSALAFVRGHSDATDLGLLWSQYTCCFHSAVPMRQRHGGKAAVAVRTRPPLIGEVPRG